MRSLANLDSGGGGDGTAENKWYITRRNNDGTQIGITANKWQYSNGFALRIREF